MVASMGPPIFIGGNSCSPPCSPPQLSRFNGATDFHRWKCANPQRIAARGVKLQWGHRFSSVEIPCVRLARSSHSALQWGHRFSSVEIGLHPPLQPGGPLASMGPPIFIGGNEQVARERPAADVASMGPPIFIGGNVSGNSVTWPDVFGLQWGHRFSSVEITVTGDLDIGGQLASMGPPIFIGGNGRQHTVSCEPIRLASMGPPIFIGGNRPRMPQRVPAFDASMGPPIFIGGNELCGREFHALACASMGPPIFIGGNSGREADPAALAEASMGPPIFIGGNKNYSRATM